jgi:riboflavin biosynthesis pyrimidine reductase
MSIRNLTSIEEVTQVFPEHRQIPLSGLYLDQKLAELSARIGRALVITNYLTDQNGIIARADEQHHFQVPVELKNPSDWQLFQELMAQADVVISGGAYLRRVAAVGSRAEDILDQFEAGSAFAALGQWRLNAGYPARRPDLAIVARSLDFKIPEKVLSSGRKTIIFTTHALANTDEARAFRAAGTVVIGSGETGVDGKQMIDTLSQGMGYRVIMMATGPSVLAILLKAKRLDLLYMTQAQRKIPFDDPSTVQTILPGGKKVDELQEFQLTHQFFQEQVVTEDGTRISQAFLRYDKKGI